MDTCIAISAYGVDSSAEDKVQMSSVQEEGGFERVDEIDIRRLIFELYYCVRVCVFVRSAEQRFIHN